MPLANISVLNLTDQKVRIFFPSMMGGQPYVGSTDRALQPNEIPAGLSFQFGGFGAQAGDHIFVGPMPEQGDEDAAVKNGPKYHRIQIFPAGRGPDDARIRVVKTSGPARSEEFSYTADDHDIFVQIYPDWSFSIRKADFPITGYPFVVNMEVDPEKFRPILGATNVAAGQLTPARFVPVKALPDMPVDVINAAGAPDRIRIKGPLDIEYHVVCKNNQVRYRPLGLALQERAANGDVSGEQTFDHIRVGPDWLTVRDNFKDRQPTRGQKHTTRYEYYILFQRQSDGAIGIIDPEIENEYPE